LLDKDNSDFLRREYCKNWYIPIGQWGATPYYIDLAPADGRYTFKNFYATEQFKTICDLNAKWYEAGYRAPAMGTIVDQNNYFYNDMLAAVWNLPVKESERIDDFLATSGNAGQSLVDIELNPGETRWITNGTMGGISAYKNSNKKSHVVDFLNWMRESRDNFDLVNYGVKDVNYHLTPEGNLTYKAVNGMPEIKASKRYTLTGLNNSWAYIDYMRFTDNMTPQAIEKYRTWNSQPNVKVSPLAGFMINMNQEMDGWRANMSTAESKYCGELLFGTQRWNSAGSGGKTFLENFLSELNPNGANDKLMAALQAQLDKYCADKGIYS